MELTPHILRTRRPYLGKKSVLITGGAGFIGSNCAVGFLKKGWNVTVFDNLSRKGASNNLEWARTFGDIDFVFGDVRSEEAMAEAFQNKKYDLVLHLAAQVAVTTSVEKPREDFEINALGTFNLLEHVRLNNPEAFVIYSSTNKVYGKMDGVGVKENATRYEYKDQPLGIPETAPLDFYSPYGCSKGSADQYVLDYGRIYGLKTCAMRQSCIYGYRQFGTEDQGWVAWFIIATNLKRPVTIYGDGKQVRDVLFVDDLADAYEAAYLNQSKAAGQSYNIGGGPANTLSLLELIANLEKNQGQKIATSFGGWRPGDQKVYISDIRKAKKDFGWEPKINVESGLKKLNAWVLENKGLFETKTDAVHTTSSI